MSQKSLNSQNYFLRPTIPCRIYDCVMMTCDRALQCFYTTLAYDPQYTKASSQGKLNIISAVVWFFSNSSIMHKKIVGDRTCCHQQPQLILNGSAVVRTILKKSKVSQDPSNIYSHQYDVRLWHDYLQLGFPVFLYLQYVAKTNLITVSLTNKSCYHRTLYNHIYNASKKCIMEIILSLSTDQSVLSGSTVIKCGDGQRMSLQDGLTGKHSYLYII